MLKERLSSRTLALVGHQTLTAKIILKKVIGVSECRIFILLVNNQDSNLRNKYASDAYFSQSQKDLIGSKVTFLPLDQLQEINTTIDVLFCVTSLVDFSNEDKIVANHLLATSRTVSALQKVTITRIVLLSSVYLRAPGYLPEEDELEQSIIPTRFTDREKALNYLQDNFSDPIEAWRWTLQYVEQSYFGICQQLTVLRVPSLGPTITNYEGYLTHMSPFAYLICQTGLGLVRSLEGVGSNKIDVVPTDYASHLMLVLAAREQTTRVETLNLSTTTRNFITLRQFVEVCLEAWREYGEKVKSIGIVETEWGRKLRSGGERLPSQVKKRLGNLLGMVSWKIEGQRELLQLQQKGKVVDKYRYFLSHEWECESIRAIDLFNQLSPEDQVSLNFNLNQLNWKLYGKLWVYSVRKHLMGHQVEPFKPQSLDLLGSHSHSYFSDIMWALRQGKDSQGQTSREAIQFVLHSKVVREAIRAAAEERMMKLQNPATSYQRVEEELGKVAEEMCVSMFSQYSMRSIRVFAWLLNKLFSSMYQRVVTNKSEMLRIQTHDESRGPLVIVPTHRSYIDFLIISYVFFGHAIKCPHIAAAEDFLNMAVVHVLLRRSGAFFIKRSQQKYKDIYRAVLNEYLAKLMLGNHYLEFFIEGTRSRTGKMLPPKLGVLSALMRHVQEGRVRDAFIMPVAVNYEKVLEGNSFTYEMMGEAKVKESLSRVIKAVDVLKQNYGRIYLEFSSPISVRDWLKQRGTFEEKVSSLGAQIVADLASKLVISGPAVVSSVLLMNRKGVSDDSLQEQSTWLAREIASRGVKLSRSQADSSVSMGSTLALMEGVVSKSKKDMFEVEVSFDQTSFVKLFTLTYHRNTLAHIFFQEATMATALSSFGYSLASEGVDQQLLHRRTLELDGLLSREFYSTEPSLSDDQKFGKVRALLESRGVLEVQEGKVRGKTLDNIYFQFYWSLVWPIAESYWIACLYLFKLASTALPLSKLLQQIQWFGQSLLNDRVAAFPEAISSDTLKNAIALFAGQGLVAVEKGQVKVKAEEGRLREMLQRLEVFLKRTYGKSLKGGLTSKQGSLSLDFPFLSKL